MANDLAGKLSSRHRAVARVMTMLEAEKSNLLATVDEADRAGWSLSAIGAALGVSKSRAQRLVQQARARRLEGR